MQRIMKSQKEILKKLGIERLNQMQLSSNEAIINYNNVIIQSPTGTGKTLAFLLPLINSSSKPISKDLSNSSITKLLI